MILSKLALSATMLGGLLVTGVAAQNTPSTDTDSSQKTPAEINREVIENAKKTPDGTVQPATGRAKPVENWFGCKPGNDKDACEAKKKKKSSATGDSTSTTSTQ